MILAAIPYMPDAIQQWDVSVLNGIHNAIYDNAFCKFFFPLITKLGDKGIFCIAVAVCMLIIGIIGSVSKKTPIEKKAVYNRLIRMASTMGVALLLGLALGNGLLKHLFLRVRPYELEGALVDATTKIGEIPHDTSFPSGHTLAVFESAIALWYFDKRVGIPSAVLAALVAFSRLYLYFHFPTDVIAGAILGSLFGFFGILIVNLVYKLIGKENVGKPKRFLNQ